MAPGLLTDALRGTLDCFEPSGAPLTTVEVAERLDLGRRSTYDRLRRLVDRDRLETKEVGASARVWWRPPVPADPTARAERDPARPPAVESLASDVLEAADVGMVVLDGSHRVAWLTEAAARYFGLDRSRVLGLDARALVEEHTAPAVEDSSSFEDRVLGTYEGQGSTARFECRVTPGDGREARRLEHRSGPIETGAFAGGRVELYYDLADRGPRAVESGTTRDRFDSLVEAVEEYAIFTLDPAGRIRSWNPGAERIKGYEAEEILGEHVSVFYTAEDRTAGVPEANLAEAAATGSIEREGWRLRKDGSRFWANVTLSAIREDGELQGYAKVTRDMTDRMERDRSLRRERNLFEHVLDASPTAIGVFDADGEPRRVNRRFADLLGRPDDDVEGYTLGEQPLLDEDGDVIPYSERPAPRALASGEAVTDRRIRVDAPDGRTRWLSVNARPFDDETDGVVVTMADVTQLKEQARRLERQRDELHRELEDVFERVDDAFFALDDEWRFTYVNERAATLLDAPAGELIGRRARDEFPGGVWSTFQRQYERARETGASVSFEEYVGSLDAWFEVSAYPSDTGISVYFRDVTERKARERELERYETIVETVEDGIYVVDPEGYITQVNDAYASMMGRDPGDLVGSHVSTVVDESVVRRAKALEEELAADERATASLEAEVATGDGERLVGEATFTLIPSGDGYERVGVLRDVTDREQREAELRERIRQQGVVTDLGRRALESHDLDALLAVAARLVAETLDTEFCKVLDLDAGAEELTVRQGVGWDDGTVGEATVSAVDDDSQAAYTLRTDRPVVVTDLEAESRFSGPDLLTDHGVRSGVSTVIGPPDDPWGIIGTHDPEPREFAERDVSFLQAVANILASAVRRHGYEEAVLRQREHLDALDGLNRVVGTITEAVIDRSTREEIETTVCDRLAATDSYLFAWIGEVDVASEQVHVRTAAGVDGSLDERRISVDPDDPCGRGPTGRALRTREMQVTRDVRADGPYDPRRDPGESHGIRAAAAIPIVHEGTTYGVLTLYTDRPDAFAEEEREVVGRLGEVVGHAIAAADRKRALLGDEVVELQFVVRDVLDAVETDHAPDVLPGPVTLDRAVPIGDDEFLVYGSASPDAADTADAVESLLHSLPHCAEVTVEEADEEVRVRALLSDPPVLTTLTTLGGSVERAVLDDGDVHATFHLSPSVDVRTVIDVVERAYPPADLVARQQVARDDGAFGDTRRVLEGDLTDRQRAAIEAAYHAGFFEWPRDASGEDLAASFGVSPSTFHQHLRTAERKVLDALLSGASATRGDV